MNRRLFLTQGALAGVGLAAFPAFSRSQPAVDPLPGQAASGKQRPNILFLFTDQWTHDVLGYAGHPMVNTPNLDRLAQQSMAFSRAYCPSPACGPSRASLFTGTYPATHGHRRNADQHHPDMPLFTDKLRKAGYKTGLVGKLHLHPIEAAHGFDSKQLSDAHYDTYSKAEAANNDYFDALARQRPQLSRAEWVAAGGRTEAKGPAHHAFWLGEKWVDDTAHHTTWTAEESIAFLRRQSEGEPWFLNASFFGPHHPNTTDFPWSELYDPAQVTLPPTWGEDKDSPIFQALKQQIQSEMGEWDESLWRQMLAQFYGYCSQIDHAIGRILNALALREDAENTWIVFSADHGDHLGNWGLLGKADPYETSIRIPMLICPPTGYANPEQSDKVVNLLDLHDTFLDMAGAGGELANSLLPVLEKRAGLDKAGTFVFQGWAVDNYYAAYIEGSRKWIAANRPDGRRLYEAYDLEQDPWEKNDLWPAKVSAADWQSGRNILDNWCREQERQMQS